MMKALVVGAGSIGTRHLRNLRKLGVESLGVVEPDARRRGEIQAQLSVTAFSQLSEAIGWNPSFVLIASPTYLHAEQTLQVLRRGLPVFVEKPLTHNAAGLFELSEIVLKEKVVSLVGCNMRFHPGPAKVKHLLETEGLGRILFARIHVGSYLPGWRPGVDYRENYAARTETGGGCLLDCIHEIDLARWYLGEVESVFCTSGHLSSLEIATEDVAALTCRHVSGAISEIHLDYVQRTYERGCQIVGERGSVFWDFNAKTVRWYDTDSNRWTVHSDDPDWDLNQMYLDELGHFIKSVQRGSPTVLPIPEAAVLMDIVFAAKLSSKEERTIKLTGVPVS